MAAVSAPTEAVDPQPEIVVSETGAEVVVETAEGAAPPETVEAGATEEPEPQLEVPVIEERRYTEAEVRQMAAQEAQNALQRDQARRQSENGRKAAEQQRQTQEASKLREAVEVALIKGGYAADEAVIGDLIQRVGSARAEIGMERNASDADLALEMLIAPIVGDTRTRDGFTLTPGAEVYASKAGPHLQRLVDALVPQIATAARDGYTANADIPKLIAADRAAQAAKSREGKTELTRVDGAPLPVDTSTVADHLDRIGTNRETPADRKWWNEREKARGRG